MSYIVASLGPHLRCPVAPQFETAPYYLVTAAPSRRTLIFPNPVQFEAASSAESLLHRLAQYAPRLILAGAFAVPTWAAARVLGVTLHAACGPACEALHGCAAVGTGVGA